LPYECGPGPARDPRQRLRPMETPGTRSGARRRTAVKSAARVEQTCQKSAGIGRRAALRRELRKRRGAQLCSAAMGYCLAWNHARVSASPHRLRVGARTDDRPRFVDGPRGAPGQRL
jgi:hypothetical protein